MVEGLPSSFSMPPQYCKNVSFLSQSCHKIKYLTSSLGAGNLFFSLTFRTLAELSEQFVRIKSSVMAIIPEELNCIKTHGLYIQRSDCVWNGPGRNQLFSSPLINAIRTGTIFTQQFYGIYRLMAIVPCDPKSRFIYLLYIFGSRRCHNHFQSLDFTLGPVPLIDPTNIQLAFPGQFKARIYFIVLGLVNTQLSCNLPCQLFICPACR